MVSRLRNVNRIIALRFVLGISIVAAAMVGSEMTQGIAFRDAERVAELVDMSGRQRMLSQRIALQTVMLHHVTDPENRSRLQNEIVSMAEELGIIVETTHHLTTTGGSREFSSQSIGLTPEYEKTIWGFITLAKRVAADNGGENRAALTAEVYTAAAAVLPIFEETTKVFVDRAIDSADERRKIQRTLLVAALLVLAAVAVFVFWPLLRRLQAEMIGLDNLNRTLEEQVEERTATAIARTREAVESRAALAESEGVKKAIFETAKEMILMHQKDGTCVDINITGAHLLDLTPEEIIGQNIYELFPQEVAEIWRSNTNRVIADGKPASYTYRWAERSFEASVYPDKDAEENVRRIVAFARDITEKKNAEDAFVREKERAEQYLAIAGTMIVALDRQGGVILVNKKGCEIIGYGQEEILGANWFKTVIPPDQREAEEHVFRSAMDGRKEMPEYFENAIVTKTGDQRLIAWHNVVTFAGDGVVSGMLGSGDDITKRVRAERELKAMEKELAQRHKMEALGQLSGGMAHEFNNMLLPVIALTELALEDVPEDSAIHGSLAIVLEAAIRARNLIKEVLAFARTEERQVQLVDMNKALRTSIKMLRAALPNRVSLTEQVEDESLKIICPSTGVQQIVMNLGTNAFHAMGDAGGELIVRLDTVAMEDGGIRKIPGGRPGRYARLTIRDTGHGMDAETAGKIFDPFFTTKEVGEGTGMGLAVVHGIVSDCGGTIRVSSKESEGTTFTVLLPLADAIPEKLEQFKGEGI